MFNPNNNYLFTEEDLNNTRYNQRTLKCSCICCHNIFLITKKMYMASKNTNNPNKNKYCSPSCRYKDLHKEETKICENCGKSYTTTNKNQRFCCIKCARSFSSKFAQSEQANNKRINSIKKYHKEKFNNFDNLNNATIKLKCIIDQVKLLYKTYNVDDMLQIINKSHKVSKATIKNIIKKYNLFPTEKFLSSKNKLKIKICKNVLGIKDRSVTESDFKKAFKILSYDFYDLNLTPRQINHKYNLNINQPTSSFSVLGLKLRQSKRNNNYQKIEDYNQYRLLCQFRFSKNVYPLIDGYNLLKDRGIWSKSNPNGVSRDHKVSIKYGFEHNIDPNIISHPANCEFISQRENASKGADCSITLAELLTTINVWKSSNT